MIPTIPNAEVLLPVIISFTMVSLRLAALFITAPVLGSSVIPRKIVAAIVLVLSVTIFLGIPSAKPMPLDPIILIIAAAGEIAVGSAAGLSARLIFAAVEGAGNVLGVPMGMGFSQLVDPMTKSNSVVTSRLLGLIASMIFVAVDGHHILIRLLANSFRILPPGEVVLSTTTGQTLASNASLIFTGAIQLAAPILLVILGSMLSLGVLARVAPKINLLVLSFAISIALGLVSLRAALPEMGVWIHGAIRRIEPLATQAIESF